MIANRKRMPAARALMAALDRDTDAPQAGGSE